MEYPMPENMGFARRSIMDMLPEEIAEADMAAIKRHVQREALGLVECVCADCGKAFVAHREHRYRYEGKDGVKMYCSHRCFRKMERKDAEAWRRRIMGAWAGPKERTNLDYAKEEVVKCREHLEAAEAKKNSAVWESMNKDQRRRLNERIAMWRARLVLAETELEEMMESEAGQSV